MRIPTQVTLAGLTVLAAASWWLGRRNDVDQQVAAPFTQPGYYLKDAELEQTDASGRLAFKVRAATATQLGQHGDVQLTQVHVDYMPAQGRDWQVTADSGTLPPTARMVLFTGDVRLSAPDEGGALVRTDHLLLDVDRQLASTPDPVRIELPPHAVSARGLRADLKRETLRLESSVNGTFSR